MCINAEEGVKAKDQNKSTVTVIRQDPTNGIQALKGDWDDPKKWGFAPSQPSFDLQTLI